MVYTFGRAFKNRRIDHDIDIRLSYTVISGLMLDSSVMGAYAVSHQYACADRCDRGTVAKWYTRYYNTIRAENARTIGTNFCVV